MDRYATAPIMQTYVLQGYGTIRDEWVRDCLHLFKSQNINLRKVVLMKNGNPDSFSMLEIHFILPQEAANLTTNALEQAKQEQPFLEQLQAALAQQNWVKQSLKAGVR